MTQFTKLTITRLTISMALVIGVGVAQAEVPVVQSPEVIELEFGQPFEYTLKASNDPLGFSIKGLPFWLEIGTPFGYEIKASGEPIGYSVSGLPFWLKREGAFLRGTPVSKKEQILQVQALNSDGISKPHQLILQVVDIGALTQEAKSVENSRHKQ